MNSEELASLVEELDGRLERLRVLYDQYFMGIEKMPPAVVQKDVDRRIWILRREKIRNTGIRFRFQQIIQRYNTFSSYWQRTCRDIENGTYKRDVIRAKKRFGAQPVAAVAPPAASPRPERDEELDIDLDMEPAVESEPPQARPPPRAPAKAPAPASDDDDWDIPAAEPLPPAPQVLAPTAAGAPRPPVVQRTFVRSALGPAPTRPIPERVELPAAPRPAANPAAAPPALPAPGIDRRGGAIAAALASATVGSHAGKHVPPAADAAPRDAVTAAAPVAEPPAVARAEPRPRPERPTPTAASSEEYRQLYARYVQTKRQNGESTAGVTYETLVRSLRETSDRLRAKSGKVVDFEVVIREGKTILKPVVR